MKLTPGTNKMYTWKQIVFKTTFMINQHFLVLRYTLNLFINVMMTSLITLHNINVFFYTIKKALTSWQAKPRKYL